MFKWLKSLFGMPEPAGPSQSLRRFAIDEPVITLDGVSIEGNTWRLDVAEPQTVRLFEVPIANVDQCMLTYRAEIMTENLSGRAYLEMWVRIPGRGEFFSKGLNHTVSGTTNWAHFEIPFYLKAGQTPDLIKLNLVVEGTGTVWLRSIELLKTPLAG